MVAEIAKANNEKVEELLKSGDQFLKSGNLVQANKCYSKALELVESAGSHRLVLEVTGKINQVVDATLKNPPGCLT